MFIWRYYSMWFKNYFTIQQLTRFTGTNSIKIVKLLGKTSKFTYEDLVYLSLLSQFNNKEEMLHDIITSPDVLYNSVLDHRFWGQTNLFLIANKYAEINKLNEESLAMMVDRLRNFGYKLDLDNKEFEMDRCVFVGECKNKPYTYSDLGKIIELEEIASSFWYKPDNSHIMSIYGLTSNQLTKVLEYARYL